ncbi:MAG TPA: RnfABCDGE type electron transport complex subunit B [Burkholderiales bacterium]|nr:RnfABCDGE type electron transport complex subunit B [Burkholderiales bacterium]
MTIPPLAERIDALLPQTQCTRCGYPCCRDYAEALADGRADINQCPPGGAAGIRRLADLLGRDFKPLNPANGREKPRAAARIDESRCIGCTLCIQACPVDAIVGSGKRMHTVITSHCNGCELCVPACPVDCIEVLDLETLAAEGYDGAARLLAHTVDEMAPVWRSRFAFHRERTARDKREREERLAAKAHAKLTALEGQPLGAERDRKKAVVAAALERARARRAQAKPKQE